MINCKTKYREKNIFKYGSEENVLEEKLVRLSDCEKVTFDHLNLFYWLSADRKLLKIKQIYCVITYNNQFSTTSS